MPANHATATLGLPVALLVPSILGWGVSGFLAGIGFAVILTAMERRNVLEDLSLLRVGVWGAAGAAVASLLVFLVMGVLPFLGFELALVQAMKAGVLGAISAAGTTKLAKSGSDARALSG